MVNFWDTAINKNILNKKYFIFMANQSIDNKKYTSITEVFFYVSAILFNL